MNINDKHLLSCLLHQQLSAVSFVRDYIEFHFDGTILRAMGDVVISSVNKTDAVHIGNTDFSNNAIKLIGQSVQNIDIHDGNCIVEFSGAQSLRIRMVPDELSGPEAMHLKKHGETKIHVWS